MKISSLRRIRFHSDKLRVKSLNLKAPLLMLLILIGAVLSACSDRKLDVNFLGSSSLYSYLQVTNSKVMNEIIVKANENNISLAGVCSRDVRNVLLQPDGLDGWVPADSLTTGSAAQIRCQESGDFQITVSSDFVGFYQSTTSGSRSTYLNIKWSVGDQTGEEKQARVRLIFEPPTAKLNLEAVNKSHSQNSDYILKGSCEHSGGPIIIHGPFAANPIQLTCNNGGFEASVQVATSSVRHSEPVTMSVQHRYFSQGKVFSENFQTVNVDLEAPEVKITAPISGQVVTPSDSLARDKKILVQGLCSEHLSVVNLRVGTDDVAVTTCTAVGKFEVIASLPGGPIEISAVQTDAAKNRGVSSSVSFENRLAGPGAFTISGVRSEGTVDSEVDGMLKDLPLVVHFASSAGATEYSVQILKPNKEILCEETVSAPASQVVFKSCAIQNQAQYLVQAVALNSYGNTTAASNSGTFSFTTEFQKPKILSVTTTTLASARLDADMAAYFEVEFNRPTIFHGASRLKFLGLSVSAEAVDSLGVARTNHKYKLVTPVNISPTTLKVSSLQSDGLVTWIDNSTAADLTISSEVSGNAYSVFQKGIVIDSSPPPIGVFKNVSGMESMTSSPVVYFDKPTHRNGYDIYTRFKTLAGQELVAWGLAGSSSISATPFEEGLKYILEYQSRDVRGNFSAATTREFIASVCPENFQMIEHGSASFCVAQFEAKRAAGKVQIIPQQPPLEVSTWQDADATCKELGSDFAVITNEQWQILANSIAGIAQNWDTQVVGLGSLKVGNVEYGKSEAVELSNSCYPRAANCATRLQRSMRLPNGKLIWDLAGNLPEHVKASNVSADPGNEGQVIVLPGNTFFSPVVTGIENCQNDQAAGCHLGYVEGTSSFYNYLRGAGFSNETNKSGLYSMRRISTGAGGVRCTYIRSAP